MPAKEPREYSLAVAQALAHSALLQFGERAAAVALSKSAWGSGRDPGSNAHEEAALGKVPLTLYQTVDEKTARRPEVGREWRRSDPGLRYVLHDDASGFEYLNHSWGPRFANAFAKPRAFAIRSDFLRLCYIAEHGGFYSDADVCPVHREVLSRMQQTRAPLILVQSMATGEVLNAFLGAVPRHPDLQPLVWAALRHLEKESYADLVATAVAGPQLLGPLLHSRQAFVLQETTTGSAIAPGRPDFELEVCRRLNKSWSSWSERPGWKLGYLGSKRAKAMWVQSLSARTRPCTVALERQHSRKVQCSEGGNNATFGCFGHGRGTHLWVKRGCRGIFRCNGNSVSCGTVGPRVSNRQSCACGDNPQGVR